MARENYFELQKLLHHRSDELLKKAKEERTSANDQLTASRGDVGDVGDISVSDLNTDYFLKLAENDQRKLIEIREAYARMQKGVYGMCESCGGEIAVERLRQVPETRFCIECQEDNERRARVGHPQPRKAI